MKSDCCNAKVSSPAEDDEMENHACVCSKCENSCNMKDSIYKEF
ncbi:hypothetical protein ACFL21_00345 [Patescibacteria group bacterium]